MSSYSGTIPIHGPKTQKYNGKRWYPEEPDIYAKVTFGDVKRDGETLSCKVEASIRGLSYPSYYGYSLSLYAQLDDGTKLKLFSKGNSPSTWSNNAYKGSGTVKVKNKTTSVKLRILYQGSCGGKCDPKGQPRIVWSKTVSAPEMNPPKVTLSKGSFTATTLSWTAKADKTSDKWRYKLDSNDWKYYTGSSTASSLTLKNISSAKHSVVVQARGKSSGKWSKDSNKVQWDCRIPTFSKLLITPTGDALGTIILEIGNTDNDVNCYVNGAFIGKTSNKKLTKSVTLNKNSNSSYNVVIKRIDNSNITNSKKLTVDTRNTPLYLSGAGVGKQIKFTVKTNNTIKCTNWKITYNTNSKSSSIVSNVWNDIITANVNLNTTYTLKATAIRSDNKASCASNTITLKTYGCSHIYVNGEWKFATMYIYTNNAWRPMTPYLYKTTWKPCV